MPDRPVVPGYNLDAEWLEADGLGGFASGTVGGERTRRYHALLLVAATPPTGRYMLVNGLDAWVESGGERHPLTAQRYLPDVRVPDSPSRIVNFAWSPWPRWRYRLESGLEIDQEVVAVHDAPRVVVRWQARRPTEGMRLVARLLLSGRDYHALHHENPAFRFEPATLGGHLVWRPYDGVPGIAVRANATYAHDPLWYRDFLYAEERARGHDFREDLASPGVLTWDLASGEAALVLEGLVGPLANPAENGASAPRRSSPLVEARRAFDRERKRRAAFSTPLERAADVYLVRRGRGRTIVAGYPWFTDWGRDTFIAIRGLCLATGRLSEARAILLEWAGAVSQGMLPNRFVDSGDAPEFNAVDASLWYAVGVHDYLTAAKRRRRRIPGPERDALLTAVERILEGYQGGTRYGIRLDSDGLLAAGEPGVQLTWMDARIGDWVVTPRIGKPVEVQALWLNALEVGAARSPRWRDLIEAGRTAFSERFWNPSGWLHDVVDPDGRTGAVDPTFRPNQILAVGGLPYPVLDGERARQVVDAVEGRLWTPLGLRSLAPEEAGYRPHYEGDPVARDSAYHQGTVWPWLLGPFVEAWVRVRGGGVQTRLEARRRFLAPLLDHLESAGLGHISEIADAEPPHTPRGCPFQAWSVGEALRLDLDLLAVPNRARASAPRRVRA